MATYRLEIAYDGTGFRGWAAQPGLRTVQAELEAALAKVLREPVALTVAGRTDTGVHATGQVASFEAEAEVLDEHVRGVNVLLPADVVVRSCAAAEPGFDARRDAKARRYRYRILATGVPDPFEEGRALWWRHRLDREALDACAAALPGTHDFTAFTPTDTEHVRFEREIFESSWHVGPPAPRARQVDSQEAGGILFYEVEADAFMRHMVRVLVGTMLEVGGGRRSLESFRELLAGAPRARAGDTAPPHGLYLIRVRY